MPPMFLWLALAVVLTWVVLRVFGGYPDPGRSFKVLFRSEVASLSAVSEAMFPAGGHIPSSGLDAELPAYVDRWMAVSQPRVRRLMHALFFLIEHATLLAPAPGRHRRRRFSSLGFEQRIAVLGAWGDSSLYARRLVFLSLRSILTMGYFAHPPVLRKLGVAPLAIESPVCEADLLYPPIGKRPSDNPLTRADLTAPSDGSPLTLDRPLHPEFAEPAGE
ncbi:MAG: hypothetical protein ACE5FL_00995 [Myxococcota bacterium]